MGMGRINTGISIDEDVLKAADEETKRTAKVNKIRWSRSRQIELVLAERYGLLSALAKPYLPRSVDAKERRS